MPNFETSITGDGDITVAGGFFSGTTPSTTFDVHVKKPIKTEQIDNATSDTDKFLVSDGGVIKYRTGAQLTSDIGAVSGFAYLPLAGNSTSTLMTGGVYFSNLTSIYWRNFDNTANTFAMLNDANNDMFLINQAGGRNIDVTNNATDGDIIFRADSGNGTSTEYFRLDGSQASTGGALYTRWADKSRVTFGDSNDLQIYHDGSDSIIKDAGTGSLDILSSHVHIKSSGGTSNMAQFFSGGNSYIYANNVLRIEATTSGASVTGQLTVNNGIEMTGGNFNAGDTEKIRLGNSADLQIYHNGSNSFIEDTGTGDLVIQFSNDLLIEGQDGANLINCNEGNSVQLYYNGSEKLETKSTGIEVTGDVLDRDIPCLFNSNFLDGTSSSIFVVPFNITKEVTVSSKIYEHYLTMPYAGKLVKIIMKNASGSLGSGFTTQLFLYVNGSQQAQSAELSIVNSAITWTPTSNNTFSAGDLLNFAYQKSASGTGVTWAGVSFGIAIELTDYDI